MTPAPAVKIAKLNANHYRVSLEDHCSVRKCWVRAKLTGPLPKDDSVRELENSISLGARIWDAFGRRWEQFESLDAGTEHSISLPAPSQS
jgi:hypothetical protein